MNNYDLIVAIQAGKQALVQALLKGGADADAKAAYNQTALSLAAQTGNPAIVGMLLESGASLKAAGDWPASWAIGGNHIEILKLLLAAGQPLHARFVTHAASEGHLDILEFLLDAGCGADHVTGDKATPLHLLARFGPEHARPADPPRLEKLVTCLMAAGAPVNHVDSFGDTALMIAARGNNLPMMEALLDQGADAALEVRQPEKTRNPPGCEPDHRLQDFPGYSGKGNTAISQARKPEAIARLLKERLPPAQIENAVIKRLLAGEEFIVRELVKGLDPSRAGVLIAGADLMKAGRYLKDEGEFAAIVQRHAHTPAMRYFGTATMYQLLFWSNGPGRVGIMLKCGASPDGPGFGIPLVRAVEGGHMEAVKDLLAAGADPNAGAGNMTPLLAALKMPYMWDERTRPAKQYNRIVGRLIDTLLAAGADPSLAGSEGVTPLHVALQTFPPHVPQLLDAGADPDAANKYGNTPLFSAGTRLARSMLEQGANPNARNEKGMTPLFFAGTTTKAELLVKYNADPYAVSNEGETALMEQARRGNVSMVRWFSKRARLIGAVSRKGDTALIQAAGSMADDEDALEMCRLLADKGEDLTTVNGRGQSVLLRACIFQKPKTAVWAISAGCDVNRQDNQGMTALLYAAQWGWTGIVGQLLEKGADTSPVNQMGYSAMDMARFRSRNEILDLLQAKSQG